MSDLVAIVWSGIVVGSLYALMSMGLSLVWGGLRILNLTQGALSMLGAYTAFEIAAVGLPPVAGMAAGFLVIGAIGVVLYLGSLRHPAGAPRDRENATLLLTFGLAIVIENAALLGFGPRSREIPDFVSGGTKVAGVPIRWNEVFIAAVAVAILLTLAAALKRTRLGLAIRALADERDGARLSGISENWISAVVMFVSAGLAGFGGVLLSSFYFASPYVGENYLLLALIVTVLGGLGSILGTLYAAYIVGLIGAAVSFYLGVRWSLPVLFSLIMLVLILRPAGIAGKATSLRL
jgi:branched-chain amino acid transport system permease protein